MYPSGHVQTGSWFTTRQFALGAQGLSYAQGLIHNLFRHAAWSGHSWLLAQPAANVGSVGGATKDRANKHHALKYRNIEIKSTTLLNYEQDHKILKPTWIAFNSRVANITLRTNALMWMESGFTSCVYPTFGNSTCIDTWAKITNILVPSAIIIFITFRNGLYWNSKIMQYLYISFYLLNFL